jgi:hypothetical protein
MTTIDAPAAPPGPTPPPGPQISTPPPMGGTPNRTAEADVELGDPFSKYGPAPEKPAEKPADKPQKPADKTPEKGAPEKTKEDQKPPKTKQDEKPPDAKDVQKEKPKTGWQRFHEEERANKELRAKLAELEKKVSGAPVTPKDFKLDEHPEYKTVKETLAQREKRLAELEDKIRFVDYEQSKEYQDTYHAPYVNTWKQAFADIEQMKVIQGENQRPGTREDLIRIVQAPDIESATAIAEELFGSTTKANYALGLRSKIIEASQRAEMAKQEFRTKGAERFKQEAALTEKQQHDRAAKFSEVADGAVEKYPQWFKPEEGDDRGNELLETGFMLANAAFGGQIVDPQTKQMREPTEDEMILINAQMRNKAAGFDRLAYKNNQLQKRISELEDALSQYEGSEPGAGAAEGKKGAEDDDDPFKKFEGRGR